MIDDDARVIVCQGPPYCDLEDDDAVAAQEAGCQLCKIITIAPDGSEKERDPLQLPN